MKFLRYLLVIPVAAAVLAFIYIALFYLITQIFNLPPVWITIILIVFGSIFTFFATFLGSGFSLLIGAISPSKKFSFWVSAILSIYVGIFHTISMWRQAMAVDETRFYVAGVVFTFTALLITGVIIWAAYEGVQEERSTALELR